MYSAFWEVTHGRLPKGKLLSTKSPDGFSLLPCSSTGPSTNSRCALPHRAGGGALQTKALPFVPGFLLHPKIPQGITPMRKRRPVTGFHKECLPMLASSAHGKPHASRPTAQCCCLGDTFPTGALGDACKPDRFCFRISSQLSIVLTEATVTSCSDTNTGRETDLW